MSSESSYVLYMKTTRPTQYRTRAPFYYGHRWHWHVWQHENGCSYSAIVDKANELKAEVWDFGQADQPRVGEVRF